MHCLYGTAKTPLPAALLSAMLMRISFEEALSIVEQACSLVRSSLVRWEIGELRPWIDAALQSELRVFLPDRLLLPRTLAPTGYASTPAPKGYARRTSRPYAGLVHATTVVEGGVEPICSSKRGASFRHDFARDRISARCIEEAASRLGGRFCSDCEALLKASLKIQVNRFFG